MKYLSRYFTTCVYPGRKPFFCHVHQWCGVHSRFCQLTTSRTVSSPVHFSLIAICSDEHAESRSFSSESSKASTKDKTQPPTSPTTKPFPGPSITTKNQSDPLPDAPLTDQTWRQFLTSDETTVVCVHPAKPVEFKDTEVSMLY